MDRPTLHRQATPSGQKEIRFSTLRSNIISLTLHMLSQRIGVGQILCLRLSIANKIKFQ